MRGYHEQHAKKRQACFELLGFDFMLDADLRVDLIEINSNPCLETWSCPLLEGLIPKLVDDVLRVGLDSILPPPSKNLTRRMAEAVEAAPDTAYNNARVKRDGFYARRRVKRGKRLWGAGRGQ